MPSAGQTGSLEKTLKLNSGLTLIGEFGSVPGCWPLGGVWGWSGLESPEVISSRNRPDWLAVLNVGTILTAPVPDAGRLSCWVRNWPNGRRPEP